MLVKDVLDDIELTLHEYGVVPPERLILLKWLSNELNELTSEVESELFYTYLDPIISTIEGQRSYDLPSNFPENFAKNKADTWAITISDGNTDVPLTYKRPQEFYSMNLVGESNSKPTTYTIISSSSGSRALLLSPPPDSTSYEISGLYKPTDWGLKYESALPPLPLNNQVLKYAVLARKLPNVFEQKKLTAKAALIYGNARGRKTVFSPKIELGNPYSSMRKY